MLLGQLIGEKRGEILAICARHGATNVRVFGSTARGEERPDSDVDFLVELDRSKSLLDHIALKHALEDLLNRKVDVITYGALLPQIRNSVTSEAVAL